MQLFEVLLYLLIVIMLFLMMMRKPIKKPYGAVALCLAVLVLMLHIIVEGARWQLYPLYIALLISGVFIYLKTIMHMTLGKWTRKGLIIGSLVFAVISLAAALSFPLYELPAPSGVHSIGTQSFVIEDSDRIERYGDDAQTFRKFKIQAWYPADTTEGYERTPWIADGKTVSRALARDIGLPFFVLDHTADIMSHSYLDAPVSQSSDEYPVVILSHGWRGLRNLHADYAEELASQGYIVIGIEHTYGSVATVMDDKLFNLDPSALPPRETTPNFLDYANQLVYTYAADVTSTINYLEAMQGTQHASQFSDALDLTNIGLLGHSTGGGGDVAVALEDDRITAVMGLDAWVEPIDESVVDNGLSIPSLFLRSGNWEESYNNDHLYTLIENSTASTALYQIDGTTHFDFAMVYMYSPLTKTIGFSGSVESERLTPMLKTMISDFFEGTLINDTGSDINPDDWEEVKRIPVE